MITINFPGVAVPSGLHPQELESDVIYATLCRGDCILDGCFVVLSTDRQFVLAFGEDSFVESASIEWCVENNVMFQRTDLEMVVSFNPRTY